VCINPASEEKKIGDVCAWAQKAWQTHTTKMHWETHWDMLRAVETGLFLLLSQIFSRSFLLVGSLSSLARMQVPETLNHANLQST